MTATTGRLDPRGMNWAPRTAHPQSINQQAGSQAPEVTATDPGSLQDMASFCTRTGNRLLSSNEVDNRFVFLIEKP